MATYQAMKDSTGMQALAWGDTVRVQRGASSSGRPGAIAEIVGIGEIETPAQADQFSAPIGGKIYMIEFGDGQAVEVPETWVEAAAK